MKKKELKRLTREIEALKGEASRLRRLIVSNWSVSSPSLWQQTQPHIYNAPGQPIVISSGTKEKA